MSQRAPSPKDATGLVFGLEDRPDFAASLVGAFQHVLASVVAIVMPTLVIGHALGLGDDGRDRRFCGQLAIGGVALVPDVLKPLPDSLSKVLESPITTSGAFAILATLLLPGDPDRSDVASKEVC